MPLRKILISLALSVLFLSGLISCRNNEDIAVPRNPEMTDLVRPIELFPDSTVIELSDLLRHPKNIDSIFLNKGLAYRISPDSLRMTLYIKDKSVPVLTYLQMYIDGYPYWLLLKKTDKIWYHFTFDPQNVEYKKVEITGDMNDWTTGKNPLRFKNGRWQTDLFIPPGRYEYQLVTDDRQIPDPSIIDKTESLYGGWNSWFRAGNISPSDVPYLYTSSAGKDKISVGIVNKTTEIFVLWQNHLLDSTFWKPDSNGISITIPKKAKDFERSFIRVYAYNASGISNEVLIPVSDGKVMTDPGDLTREDQEAMIIYSLLTDRFVNGNSNNDSPVRDSLLDRRLNFQGGDFSGILNKIEDDYFGKLGVNTLWISPVAACPEGAYPDHNLGLRRSTGYHGYWPVSLSVTEKRFGTGEELKSLVEEAHSKDLNVILDMISNKMHEDSRLYKEHPEWFNPQLLENKRKNVRLWKENPYTTWFDDFLPTFDLSNAIVDSMMTDSAIFWIKAYDIDGFRHDAANHVRDSYWRMLSRKIRENVVIPDKRPVFQIGECFGSREKISEYISPGIMDGMFDFNLYLVAAKSFARDNASLRDLNYALKESINAYGDHSLMGNISGAGDLPRFISYASGELQPGQDYMKSAWEKNIAVTDTTAYKKLALLHAFNFTIPGIPVIYYGDEIGMPGAGEPDNRRVMRFDSLDDHETKLKQIVEKLAEIRKNSMPLLYGDFKPLLVNDRIYVYMRSYFGKVVFVIFNKNYTAEDIIFEVPERYAKAAIISRFGSKVKLEKGRVSLILKGNSFEILSN